MLIQRIDLWDVDVPKVMEAIAIYLVCFIIGFRVYHTYSGVIRYSSFIDLLKITKASIMGGIMSVLASFVISKYLIYYPIAAIVLGTLAATALMWLVRVFVKLIYDVSVINSQKRIKVFIYGVREGGIALAKSIRSDENSPFILSGFISDRKIMVGKRLMGVSIFANDEDIVEKMKKHGATALLVSPLKNEEIRNNHDMVDRMINAGIKIHMMSGSTEWDGKSEVGYTQLREVSVEDLLPREIIEVDMDAVGDLIRGKRILITGAAGSIGSEMVRQIAPYQPAELMLIDQAETPLHDIRLMMAKDFFGVKSHTIVADIANERRMEEIFSSFRPEYVFHAAAYKHVPMMEDNPSECIENNVNGTRVIADLAVKYGTRKFVMVSTDKAVNPTNVMGCSKRLCEIYVQSLDKAIKDGNVKGETKFVTTRFGNVLGSNGSVIPLFKRQIKAGGPVTVTHPDIIRYFMLIPEACKLVLEAGTMGNGGEIYVFDMGKPVKIVDLARRMITLSGAKDIEIKFTGLRDGEKLYEEVLNEKETTLPTFHEKIKIAKVREYEYVTVNQQMIDLIHLAISSDDMTIVRAMKDLVPEFKSQHSKYEALDK
ncbi:MAG: polysaccharide biosynthesis protein [Lachnoclostridium sp.]|nr:polysaccharide biosynthesis protein [Lachnoclostridium sp.]